MSSLIIRLNINRIQLIFPFWQKILRPKKILLLNEKNCVSLHRETDAKQLQIQSVDIMGTD